MISYSRKTFRTSRGSLTGIHDSVRSCGSDSALGGSAEPAELVVPLESTVLPGRNRGKLNGLREGKKRRRRVGEVCKSFDDIGSIDIVMQRQFDGGLCGYR
jgi:hypothetical protein